MDIKELNDSWLTSFKIPLVIAGPCSAETKEQVLDTASKIDRNKVDIFRAGIWKPRTRPGGFEGVGEEGLKWLQEVREKYGFKTATEVATAEHARLALQYDVDILWIGARSTSNPFSIQEIADTLANTDKIILIKNPVNADIELWIGAIERLMSAGIRNIGIIHRGFSSIMKSKYRNAPFWNIALELKERYPNLIFISDPSHICGNREGLFEVSQQAIDLGYEGLMIETHHNPDRAWSDAKQQITPERLSELLEALIIPDIASLESAIKVFRHQIDELDLHMLEDLVMRMNLSKQIGHIKKSNNLEVYQPERWVELQNILLVQGAKMGLSESFIKAFTDEIHKESILRQEDIINGK